MAISCAFEKAPSLAIQNTVIRSFAFPAGHQAELWSCAWRHRELAFIAVQGHRVRRLWCCEDLIRQPQKTRGHDTVHRERTYRPILRFVSNGSFLVGQSLFKMS